VFPGGYVALWQAPRVPEMQAYGAPAGPGRRLLAFVVDGVLSDLVALLFTKPPSPAYSGLVLLIFIVERIVLTALTGASFGQRVAGLTVIRLDGRPVGFAKATIRTLLLALLVPVLLVGRDGRGLHDRAADTAIIRR
jgi:uncharacterized RDD family membrane protein YckC